MVPSNSDDPVQPPSAVAGVGYVADPQWFALTWYGQTLQHLCASAELVKLDNDSVPKPLAQLEGVASGHVVAVSASLAKADAAELARGVVIGGPCIGDCMQFPTLEALYDSVQTLLTAKALGASALLYLGDREEVLGRGGGEGKWGKLALAFETWLVRVAEALGCESSLVVVRTSSERHEQALAAVAEPAKKLEGSELEGAFSLGSRAVRAQDEAARGVTRRVIEAHLPAVVASHLDRDPSYVVMAENLQQAALFRLAARLAAESGHTMDFVGHWPAPGLTSGQRMYRSESWAKIPAWGLEAVVTGEHAGLHPYTAQFFACWLDAERRAALADAARRW